LTGAGNHGQGVSGLNTPGAPTMANMQSVVRLGCGGARLLPMSAQTSQSVSRNLAKSSSAVAGLDRLHQHGKLSMSSLKIVSFDEVPMTVGTQQKLLIWLKNTTRALVAYRTTTREHEDIILQKLTDAILQPAKLTWDTEVESAMLEQPLTGARRGVGTVSLTWCVYSSCLFTLL
jgi:hypothetical protein